MHTLRITGRSMLAVGLVGLVVLVAGCGDREDGSDGRPPTSAARQSTAPMIVYVDGEELRTIRTDGTGRRRLRASKYLGFPAWSPDAGRIAYSTELLELIRPDGTREPWNFAGRGTSSWDPTWSPDGKRIACASHVYHEVPGTNSAHALEPYVDLYAVHPGTGENVRLTSTKELDESQPAWSPDGTQLAFTVNETRAPRVFVLDLATHRSRELAAGRSPDWSPDGRRLAFATRRADGGYAIAVMNADGSSQRELLTSAEPLDEPSWSPDGTQIAYVVGRPDGAPQIFIAAADGSQPRFLIIGRSPDWRPTP